MKQVQNIENRYFCLKGLKRANMSHLVFYFIIIRKMCLLRIIMPHKNVEGVGGIWLLLSPLNNNTLVSQL